MNIESLRENLTKKLITLKNRIEETEAYNRARETYQGLSPKIQKLIKFIFIFLIAYPFYSLPNSYIKTAKENMGFFEENRNLTKGLIRAGRIASNSQSSPSSLSTNQLRSMLEAKISSQGVSSEQRKEITPLNQITDKSLIPGKVKQKGLKVKIDKLNLRQLILLGESFDSIESSRLMNLSVTADKLDPHYFNVEYEVATFFIPSEKPERGENNTKSSLKKKDKKKNK